LAQTFLIILQNPRKHARDTSKFSQKVCGRLSAHDPKQEREIDGRSHNATVYKDDLGNVLGVLATARDITQVKRTSEYARSLIEASLDPLVTVNPDGKITDVNEASVNARVCRAKN